MGSESVLILAMALPPVWMAGGLWWFVTHATPGMGDPVAFPPGRFDE